MGNFTSRGIVILISDFFDEKGCERAVEMLRSAGHDFVLLQVHSAEEQRPSAAGELILEDVETGAQRTVECSPQSTALYERRFLEFSDASAAAGLAQRRTICSRSDKYSLPGICAAKPAQRAGAGMNWLALSPAEVAAVWAGLAALALWLYLHHRRPQRRKVSTLRFWASVQPVSQPRRRKLREPWALARASTLLVAADSGAGESSMGSHDRGPQRCDRVRHVDLVAGAPRGRIPVDRSRARGSPARAGFVAGERSRAACFARRPMRRRSCPSPRIGPRCAAQSPASNLRAASPTFRARWKSAGQALAGSRRGLLVYVGPGMLDEEQARSLDEFRASMETPGENGGQPQFLVRLAGDGAAVQNRGITRLSLRRDAAQPDLWHLLTQLKNYSDTKADVVLKFSVDGQPIGQRTVALAPNELPTRKMNLPGTRAGSCRRKSARLTHWKLTIARSSICRRSAPCTYPCLPAEIRRSRRICLPCF